MSQSQFSQFGEQL